VPDRQGAAGVRFLNRAVGPRNRSCDQECTPIAEKSLSLDRAVPGLIDATYGFGGAKRSAPEKPGDFTDAGP
jgi:hypothetical protein